MSNISETIWMAIIGILIVAILFMLVRPGSPAAQAVTDVSGALAALVAISTDNFGGTTNGQ